MWKKNNKIYKDKLRDIFYKIRIHPWYQKVMLLPLWIRITISVFLFLFGIIGLLTPIPAGWVMILSAGVLVFGIHVIKRYSIKIFFLLRIHRIYEWIRYKFKR